MRAATTARPDPHDNRFPPGIPYIVGNEAAERFSFYGLRQILYIYLVGLFVGFASEHTVPADLLADAKVRATQWQHIFMAGVYLFPLIGGILADRLLGKYRVIFWVSLIYVAGHGALAVAGRAGTAGNLGGAELFMIVGLALIAVGSGGIKPCVSANVGDQFTAANGHLVPRIFQLFYFVINFGSFFASFLIPLIYKWQGPEWAFGVPGLLMALAAFIFWLGRRKFVRVPAQPGGSLGLLDFVTSTFLTFPLLFAIHVALEESNNLVQAATDGGGVALLTAAGTVARHYWGWGLAGLGSFGVGFLLAHLRQQRVPDTGFLAILLYCFRHRGERGPGDDFWTPARRRFGDEAAEGPPAVLRIIVVFSMVSVFWALFDQHSSTWVEQAKAMGLSLVVPDRLFAWLAWGAVPAASLYGLVWLLLWVSNVAVPRLASWLVVAVLAVSGLVAGWLQLHGGAWQEIHLLPAQISALNPLLVMVVIPLLNVFVYSPCERRGRPLKPLHRMTAGMFLAATSFVAVALLQARIQAAGPGQVHVLWQIIPYSLLTVAEVLVSVTGLEFAYTQAPRTMKSTIMSFWLLCVTFGNILVAFLAPLQKLSLTTFFWTFAGLMAGAALIFAVLASFYRGKTYLQPAEAAK